MIKITERDPDNKVYLIHLIEHSDTVKKLISELSTKLNHKFTPEELSLSQGPDLSPQRNLTTFATPPTRKNAEYLRNLHGINQPLVNRPPPRHSRRPITASYPQDFPTLPTGKSNSWDDRRAGQKKATQPGEVDGHYPLQTNRITIRLYFPCPIITKTPDMETIN